MAQIEVDERDFPIVVLRFPASWTHSEYAATFARVEEILNRKKRCAFVSDTRGSAIPDAHQRKMSAEFFEKNDAVTREILAGWAVVADSVLARGAVTAISWLRPPNFALKTFSAMPEALAWCRERIDKR